MTARELADKRTTPIQAPGGSPQDCPGRQENGTRGSRESGPPEDRYKANPVVPAPQPLTGQHEEGTGQRVKGPCATIWASTGGSDPCGLGRG